jgi:hypothetical protein
MAMDWLELVAWYGDAVELDKARTRNAAIETANMIGRAFGGR